MHDARKKSFSLINLLQKKMEGELKKIGARKVLLERGHSGKKKIFIKRGGAEEGTPRLTRFPA